MVSVDKEAMRGNEDKNRWWPWRCTPSSCPPSWVASSSTQRYIKRTVSRDSIFIVSKQMWLFKDYSAFIPFKKVFDPQNSKQLKMLDWVHKYSVKRWSNPKVFYLSLEQKSEICVIKTTLWKFSGLVTVMKFGDDGNNYTLKILWRCPCNFSFFFL